MNDFDLDRLGDVWRQQPDPAELEALRRAADYVRRRARWAQLFDVVSAIAVAGVVLFLVIVSDPRKETFIVGGAAILMLLLSQMRQRRLRQEELKGLTGSAEDMLDQSVTRVEATLRRIRFSLLMLPPALAVGIIFSYVVDTSSEGQLLSGLSADPAVSTVVKAAIAGLVAAAVIYLLRALRRERGELDRLVRLRDAYRKESEASAAE